MPHIHVVYLSRDVSNSGLGQQPVFMSLISHRCIFNAFFYYLVWARTELSNTSEKSVPCSGVFYLKGYFFFYLKFFDLYFVSI